jgi:hypothetical protein
MTKTLFAFLAASALSVSFGQSPAPATKVEATLGQLMKGTLYPESNVVFAAQDVNPTDVPHAKDPSMSTDLLTSQYGKWEAVENSALAIAEVANLLSLPGRKCSNGAAVPIANPDWAKFVQGLRDAAMMAYAGAQAKNQDKMTDVAGVLTEACQNCHVRYREKRNPADRCK